MKKNTATVIKIIAAVLAIAAAAYCIYRYRKQLMQAVRCLKEKLQSLHCRCSCPDYDDYADV